MVANTVSRVRPEADQTVLTNGRVVLPKIEPRTNARHEGWLLAQKAQPQDVDNFIDYLSNRPEVESVSELMNTILEPEQIDALKDAKAEIDSLGHTGLEAKIEMSKAMLKLVSDAQAYQIFEAMTEELTGEHANHDRVMSEIEIYRNKPTAEIIDSLVVQLDESALKGDLTAEKIPSQAKLADPILVS
ncbi:MAG: hypothetical protein O3C63_06475 [Cyanobacteria bacterium]|nr:hypothetical protein [Cyanobacteriota bacterium]